MSRVNREPPSFVRGSEFLVSVFGEWPSFHDFEIISLYLVRVGISHIIVTEPGGGQEIRFEMESIEDLELIDFSHQNVVYGIDFEHAEDESVTIRLSPSFGLCGWIRARVVSAAFVKRD